MKGGREAPPLPSRLLLPLAVAVTVAVLAAVAVLAVVAVFAVAVVIAVLALVHVDAVYQHAGVGQLLLAAQLVEQLKVVLARIVGTAHIDTEVGHTSHQQRVGHGAHGSRVQNDVVEMLLQQPDGFLQRAAPHKFGRIRRNGSARQHVQIR